MPLAHICSHCFGDYAHGTKCGCDGATAARKRRADYTHAQQRMAGRDTAHWRTTRERRRDLDGYRCVVCGRHQSELATNERLTVHLGPHMHGQHAHATVDDCQTRCSTCHGKTHGRGRR